MAALIARFGSGDDELRVRVTEAAERRAREAAEAGPPVRPAGTADPRGQVAESGDSRVRAAGAGDPRGHVAEAGGAPARPATAVDALEAPVRAADGAERHAPSVGPTESAAAAEVAELPEVADPVGSAGSAGSADERMAVALSASRAAPGGPEPMAPFAPAQAEAPAAGPSEAPAEVPAEVPAAAPAAPAPAAAEATAPPRPDVPPAQASPVPEPAAAARTRSSASLPVRSVLRWPAAVALLVIGAIHLPTDLRELRSGDLAAGASLGIAAVCIALACLLPLYDPLWAWMVGAAAAVGIVIAHSLATELNSVHLLRDSLGSTFTGATRLIVLCAVIAAALAATVLTRKPKVRSANEA